MFLFRMHSIGSVRPVPRASAVANHLWNNKIGLPQPPSNQDPDATQELDEDVVVIQEEEMVLVRNQSPELNQEAPPQETEKEKETETEEEPQPQCMEPESTVSAPSNAPSKSKPKKKQQKRK